MDLVEMQGSPESIASAKAIEATSHCDTAVMIEDVSLCFNALKGLPGPYIKDFLTNVGREGLHKMLHGFEDKTAYAQCTFAYCEGKGKEPILFVGKCNGTIVAPQGDNAFGWDPIFMPEGFTQTFAEISMEEKNKISHRGRALEKVKEYLEANSERLNGPDLEKKQKI